MSTNFIKHELQTILSGKSEIGSGNLIESTINYLRRSSQASSMAEDSKQNKLEEKKKIMDYADSNNHWVKNLDLSKFISAGAEQRVYIYGERSVYKLNDSIYYAS